MGSHFEAQEYFVSDVGRVAANGGGIVETLPLGLQSNTPGSVAYHSYGATTNVVGGSYIAAAWDTGRGACGSDKPINMIKADPT